MDKKVVNTSRGNVYYWICKNENNKCITFTHGLTADHTLFDMQIEFWRKEYTVIVWDMPLHGESRPYDNFSFSNAADDIKKILDNENITHTVMAGQSAGGYIVQEFIRRYPNMADAFISIDSTPLGIKYYKKSELFVVCNFGKLIRLYPFNYYCRRSAQASTRTKESEKSFYNSLKKLGKNGIIKAITSVYRDLKNYEEVCFKCPVLLVLGEFDTFGSVKKYNEIWKSKYGYPSIIISNSSHTSNYDNYKEFNEKVYEFLNQYIE